MDRKLFGWGLACIILMFGYLIWGVVLFEGMSGDIKKTNHNVEYYLAKKDDLKIQKEKLEHQQGILVTQLEQEINFEEQKRREREQEQKRQEQARIEEENRRQEVLREAQLAAQLEEQKRLEEQRRAEQIAREQERRRSRAS